MLEEEWDLMDKDKSGDLDLDELFLLMEHLNVQITRKTVRRRPISLASFAVPLAVPLAFSCACGVPRS